MRKSSWFFIALAPRPTTTCVAESVLLHVSDHVVPMKRVMQGQVCHKPAKIKLDKYDLGDAYVWSQLPIGNPIHHIAQISVHLVV